MRSEGSAELRRLLAARDPFKVLEDAVPSLGEWRDWPIERQVWALRVRRGLTQAQWAAASGVSQHSICAIERGGGLKVSTLRALMAPLGYRPVFVPVGLDAAAR